MFHWMPHRITAHVKLCVLALMIQRTAEIATSMTWRQIHDTLEPVKAVRYRSENRTIVQTSKIQPDTRDILKTLKYFNAQDDPHRRLNSTTSKNPVGTRQLRAIHNTLKS